MPTLPRTYRQPILLSYRTSPNRAMKSFLFCEELDLNVLPDGTPAVHQLGPTETQTLTEVRNEATDRD